MTPEERLWLWLNYATGHDAELFYTILEQIGDLEEAYDLVQNKDWEAFDQMDQSIRNRLSSAAEERFLERYTGWMEKNGVKIVTPASDDYPALLERTQNPPSVLFYRGFMCSDLKLPIAFMSFSNASEYGKDTARILGRQIAENGGTVVAGVDKGIGSAALGGALECVLSKVPAVGILPCGIDRIPDGEESLCRELSERGCLLTEFLPKSDPGKGIAGRMNRLAKRYSRAMILIEANPDAQYTGKNDSRQENGWYAVPGRISDPYSSLSNRMIREQNAKPVLGVNDILSDFSDLIDSQGQEQKAKRNISFLKLNDLAQRIYMALRQGNKSVDDLAEWVDAEPEEIEDMLRKMKNAEIVNTAAQNLYTIDQTNTVVTFGE